jgi:hypothetical protein
MTTCSAAGRHNEDAGDESAMNSERQNTISHALVIDNARTSRPPDDQQMAATTATMARRWRAAGS